MQNEPHSTFVMGDRLFDFVKKLVQIILPASGAAYFGLSKIWGWPNAEEVVGTIAVIQTFLGVCLGISTAQYNAAERGIDGKLTMESVPGEIPVVTSLSLDKTPEDLEGKKSVTVKIEHETPVGVDVLEVAKPKPKRRKLPKQ